ncbi:hypothetical protein GI075_02580 [Salmonella enterica]|uniref:Tetratricopeptide repeat protein n=2 Tax=Salmonella enterica I TaxID=59201 RepID=A0A735CRY6_SALMU|nr:hypothetical protein [Salmonella enterica]EAA3639947.1 hypothetical protein [Salmonella enterica subsp. enterica serovar Hessarek]EBG5024792.1 hypothetical protein [Salmonella enterica subsp. enterica serovar Oranienburg]EBU6612716.1 hypothetical protein [Salmonella enterica subsp. enterica serovar Derby]ECD6767469.1 hypothetical protein [Salmonella enterica subsp. enterica serovar Newport]ECG0996504.1 hypothetical protein [Salmonella enterica subsp. enterica]ECS8461983.1 hypothetical prot
MSLAQPKSGELLDLLGPSLTQGENLLSEFEIHRVIREARKVPEYYQGLSIEGLAKLVLGEIEEGAALCEKSLALAPDDSVSFCNYTIALRNKGYHVKQYEIIKRAINSRNPRILSEVAVNAAYWVDLDLLKKVMPMLNAMEVAKADDLVKCNESLDYLIKHDNHSQDFKAIGRLMMAIAEKYRLRLAGANAFYVMNELNTFFVEIKTDDPALLSKVNNDLADALIAAGLENSECIGCFQAGDF